MAQPVSEEPQREQPPPLQMGIWDGDQEVGSATFVAKSGRRVGLQGDRYMAHSLRIGGATALYQATGDIELVKRIGRWTSSAVHRYLEDGGTISNASRKMADVRLKNI